MTVADLVTTYGLPVVVLGAMVEGETVVIAAGYLAHRHGLPIWSVAACAAVGAMIGDQGLFVLGRRFGDRVLRRLPRRLRGNLGRARDAVESHPARVLLSMRFLYGMRIALPLLCGASRMRVARFISYNVATAIVWAVFFAGIGYEFGAVATAALRDIEHYEWLFLVALVPVALLIHRVGAWLRGRLTDGGTPDGS